jgi:tripartite-type tricarboxylate transporter receptor subunit TctC
MVVPFTPGGSNDVMARHLAVLLGKSLGQSVIVENRGGAAGVVGSNWVANAAPDGYTFLFDSSSLATSAATQNPPYDTLKAFDAVARVADSPFVMVVRKDMPAKNLQQFIAYAKANPQKVNYGTTGSGDIAHLLSERFGKMAGIKMQAVSYKGIGQAQLDLIAGRIDLIITTIASIGGTAADSLPKLAFTGAARAAQFPEVPTVREASGLDYVADVWWGVFAPHGTPAEVRNRMNHEINSIASQADFIAFLKQIGAKPAPATPQAFAGVLTDDVTHFTETARQAGIQIK